MSTDEPTAAGGPHRGEQPAPVQPPEPVPPRPVPEEPAAQAAQPPGYGYPAAAQQQYPFAPVPRPPREPWVHPRRRGMIAAIGVGAALICFGAGIGVGVAIAPGGDHNHRPIIMRPYDMPNRGPGMGRLPRRGYPPGPGATRTPAPSSTS
jgi:hypothetical protein